jgi:hypothetical protein
MNDTVYQDFVLQEHQRRVEESLRIYQLFKPNPSAAEEPKARLTGRWFDVKGLVQVCWSVAFGLALNKP